MKILDFKTFLLNEDKLETIKDMGMNIDIHNMDIYTTAHGKERLKRDNHLKGMNVTNDELVTDIKTALPDILNDYANGEIPKDAIVLITNQKTKLNIVGSLRIQKGKDFFGVITVLRTHKFHANDIDAKYEI